MFGPQARAAELQAVRSAAIRQRSHESENVVLGPAAVSLTDFARAQPTSRNKGSKPFKALVLEELLADTEEDVTEDTVQRLDEVEIRTFSETSEFQPSSASKASKPTPVAPKAMMLTTTSSRPSPGNVSQVHTPYHVAPTSQRMTSAGRWATRPSRVISTATHGAPIMFDHVHQPPFHAPDFVYGLEGYSPAKPELQIEFLRDSRSRGDTYKPLHTIQPEMSHLSLMPIQTVSNPQSFFPYDLGRAVPPFLPSLQFTSRLSGHDSPYAVPHLERSHTFASDVLDHENSLQESRAAERRGHEPPYDRNTKMQNFVAAQQAMAKTGKTVLHNPDLHKVLNLTPQRRSSDVSAQQAATPSRSIQDCGNNGRATGIGETGSIQRFNRPAEKCAAWEAARKDLSPGQVLSESSSDPFASGFTPQLRQQMWTNGAVSEATHTSSQRPSRAIRRRPADCTVIWRAMQASAKRTESSTTGDHRTAFEPAQGDLFGTGPGPGSQYRNHRTQAQIYGMLHPLSWCSSAKFEHIKERFQPTTGERNSITSFAATVGMRSREWLLQSTEGELAMQEEVVAFIQDHGSEKLQNQSAVGLIGEQDESKDDERRTDIAVGIAKALVTVQRHHEDQEQIHEPRGQSLSYQKNSSLPSAL